MRGGASSTSSSDVGAATTFAHHCDVDVNSDGSVNAAAGSGISGSRGWLDQLGVAVERVSAGVLAREEGRRSRALDHFDEQEEWFRNFWLGRNRVPISQSSVVEG